MFSANLLEMGNKLPNTQHNQSSVYNTHTHTPHILTHTRTHAASQPDVRANTHTRFTIFNFGNCIIKETMETNYITAN